MIDFVIALRSPAQNPETGPTVCLAEKVEAVDAWERQPDIFSSPVSEHKIADRQAIPEDSRKYGADFSVLQTTWRSGQDSNPSVQV
jgi:hypothetical protein